MACMGFRRLPAVLVFLLGLLVAGMPSAVAGASSTAGAATAGAWRSVTFEHVTIEVPAGWPVYNLTTDPARCPRLDRHAVYLGRPGPDPSCPAGELTGKTEAVQLLPASAQSPDVRAATRAATIARHPRQDQPGQRGHAHDHRHPARRQSRGQPVLRHRPRADPADPGLDPGDRPGGGRQRARCARARGDPAGEAAGHLSWPGLRHLRRAVGGHHEPLAQVAVPGDRHLHRRGQPRLRAGQPQRELAGRHPEPGLALLPVLRRAAGVLRGRIRRLADHRVAGRRRGHRGRQRRRAAGAQPRHPGGHAADLRHGGVRQLRRAGDHILVRVGLAAARRRLRGRRLRVVLERVRPHQRGRPDDRAGCHPLRGLGRQGDHDQQLHAAQPVDQPPAAASVPGRAQRVLGRRQHERG